MDIFAIQHGIELIATVHTASTLLSHIPGFSDRLLRKLQYLFGSNQIKSHPEFSNRGDKEHKNIEFIEIDELIRRLDSTRGKVASPSHGDFALTPLRLCVQGSFIPRTLFTPLWWLDADDRVSNLDKLDWKDSLSHWLFHGFTAWGASMNLNRTDINKANYDIIFGQLGAEDEANSLPVVIFGNHARNVAGWYDSNLDWLLNTIVDNDCIEYDLAKLPKIGHLATRVKLQGYLLHVDDLLDGLSDEFSIALKNMIQKASPSYKYLIVVLDISGEDFESLILRQSALSNGVYSAYLWQILKPTSESFDETEFGKLFFAWEHVNLMSSDSMSFGFQSLLLKSDYLSKRYLCKYGDYLTPIMSSSGYIPNGTDDEERESIEFAIQRLNR